MHKVLVGKLEIKRPLGRSSRRWEDNIKMVRKEMGWGMYLIDLAQDRNRWEAIVSAVMNICVT